MTAVQKEMRFEGHPFGDNQEFLQAKHDEVMAALRVAGVRAHVETRQARWDLKGSTRDEEDHVSLELLQRRGEQTEREFLQLRAVNEARLAVSSGVDLPFRDLVDRCRMDLFDQQVLWLLVFKAVSPDFRERYDQLGLARFSGDSRDTLCIGNVLQILCPDGILSDLERRRHFATDAPLVRHHLVRLEFASTDVASILEFELAVPQRIVGWITGDTNQYLNDSPFEVEWPTEDLDCVVLPEELLQRVVSLVERHGRTPVQGESGRGRISYGRGLTILEYGPSGTGKTLLARALAHHTGRPLVSSRRWGGGGDRQMWPRQDTGISELFLEARLQDGIAFIDECEEVCRPESEELSQILVELERTDGIVIMATNQPEELAPSLDRRFGLKIPFHRPDAQARRRIWALHLDEVDLADDVDLNALANEYRLAGGYIKNASFFAINLAAPATTEGRPVVYRAQLEEAAQMQEQHVGSGTELCRRYRPARGIAELMVNESVRTELDLCVRALGGYEEQWQKWGISRSGDDSAAGVRLLFYGADFRSGMQGAEAIAAALRMQIGRFRLADLADPRQGRDGRTCTPQQALMAATQVRQVVLITDEQGWLGKSPETTVDGTWQVVEFVRELPGYTIIVSAARVPRLARALHLFHREVLFGLPDVACRRRAWENALAGAEGVDPEQVEALAHEHELSMDELRLAVERTAFQVAGTGSAPREVLPNVLAELRKTEGPLFG